MADNTRNEIINLVFKQTGNEELAQLAGTLHDVAAAGGEAGAQAQFLLDQITTLSKQDALIASFVETKAAAGDVAEKLADASEKLVELKTQLSETTNPSDVLQRSFAKQQQTVDDLVSQHNKLVAAVTAASAALKTAGVDTGNLDGEQRRIQTSLADVSQKATAVGKGMKDVATSTDEAGQKAKEADGFFSTVKEHLAEIVSVAAAAELALKGIEFGKESVKEAADIEESVSRIRATAQGAQQDFEGLDSAISDAAEAVNTTEKNAAAGLAQLTARGLDANAAITALVPTLQLAKIANIDVGQAAEIVTKSLNAFNLPASAAQAIVDKLTVASHGAAGGLNAIGGVIGQLAPDARALGLNFDQLVGIVGVLSQRGIDSTQSMRGLRSLFQELQNPTSALRVQLLALGDGTGDFGRAIATLSANTPRAQQALQSLSGPTRSLVLALGQEGPAALAKFTQSLEQANGAATRTSAVIDQNLNGAWRAFENAIDSAGAKLAKPILQPLAAELVKLAGQINEFSKSPDFQKIIDDIGGIVKKGVQLLDNAIQNFDWKSFGKNAKDTLDQVKASLDAVADSASKTAAVVGKIGDVVGGAYHLIGATVDSVVAGGARAADAVVKVEEKLETLAYGSDEARKHLEGVHNALQSVDTEATENAGKHVDGLVKDFKDLGGATQEAAKGTTEHAAAAHAAAPKVQEHAAASKESAIATGQLSATLQPLPSQIKAVGDAAPKTAAQLVELARQGKLSTEDLEGAFKGLGITSQQSLDAAKVDAKNFFEAINLSADNTAKGLADKQNAFLAYAQKVLAANAQLDDGAKAQAYATLEQQAAVLGITDALADLEKQSANSQAALVSDADRSSAALQREFDQAQKLAGSFSGGGSGGAKPVDKAAKDAQDAVDEMASGGGSSLAQLDQALGETRAQFSAVSDAAAKAFDTALLGEWGQTFDATGIGFARVIESMNLAAQTVNQQLANQRTQLQNEISVINDLGTASKQNFGAFGDDATAATAKIEGLVKMIQSGKYEAGLLGQQDLAGLQQALEAAAQRAQALADKEAQAKANLEDLDNQLQDQIDQLNGDQEDQENRRFQQQLADIKAEATTAGVLNKQLYDELIAKADQYHDLKMKQIEQQNAAQGGSNSDGSSSSSSSGGVRSGGGSGGGAAGAGLVPINIHVNGTSVSPPGSHFGTPQMASILADLLRSKSVSQ